MTATQKVPGGGPKTWTVKPGSGEPLLTVLPLGGAVSAALAAELVREGYAGRCAECEKPFTAVRKRRGIGRVRHFDPADNMLYNTTWLLCGRCTARMRANGGRLSDKLIAEAREASSAMITMNTPAGGHA